MEIIDSRKVIDKNIKTLDNLISFFEKKENKMIFFGMNNFSCYFECSFGICSDFFIFLPIEEISYKFIKFILRDDVETDLDMILCFQNKKHFTNVCAKINKKNPKLKYYRPITSHLNFFKKNIYQEYFCQYTFKKLTLLYDTFFKFLKILK